MGVWRSIGKMEFAMMLGCSTSEVITNGVTRFVSGNGSIE